MKKLFGFGSPSKCPACGVQNDKGAEFCKECGKELSPKRGRPERTKDYRDRCGNCHAWLGDDEYCRCCGTKKGEGRFEPYFDEIQCVYGPPPVNRLHTCGSCGFEWTTCQMIDDQGFCPKCGSRVSVKELRDTY